MLLRAGPEEPSRRREIPRQKELTKCRIMLLESVIYMHSSVPGALAPGGTVRSWMRG